MARGKHNWSSASYSGSPHAGIGTKINVMSVPTGELLEKAVRADFPARIDWKDLASLHPENAQICVGHLGLREQGTYHDGPGRTDLS